MKSIHKRLAEALAFNPLQGSKSDPDTGERLQGRKWFPKKSEEDEDEDDDYARYLSSKEDGSGMDESSELSAIEKEIRSLRQNMFNLTDAEQDVAGQRIQQLKKKLIHLRSDYGNSEQRGPYSGLTRGELSKSGTSEPDWF